MRFSRLAFVISISLVLGHLGNAADAANATEERNFEPSGVLGPAVPAIPASELQESKGKVTVKIGNRKYKLETLTATPPGAGPFPLAVVSHGTPTRGGGFVVSALASKPPAGLVGIVDFAGGRGGQKDGGNCSESGFVGAFGEFGKGARVPALWLYAATDRMFRPELIDRALAA